MTDLMLEKTVRVAGGVDTHLDVHVVAALDQLGRVLGTASFEATACGYEQLGAWLESFGVVACVGVEGTGAYGSGLARHLAGAGVRVVEVDRPNRQARRLKGKSDPLDAIEAARSAWAAPADSAPKSRSGQAEAIRALLVAKRSARRTRVRTIVQMRHLSFTAPEALRCRLRGLGTSRFVSTCARLRTVSVDPVLVATTTALRVLARRVQRLDEELASLNADLSPLVRSLAPALLARPGIGIDTAAALLAAVGDNPKRLHSEAAFARLCGVAPQLASSGKVSRHRLDRGGNRQANEALWRIVMCRLAHDPATRAYMERRVKDGRSKREVIRSLKRYVAREVFNLLATS